MTMAAAKQSTIERANYYGRALNGGRGTVRGSRTVAVNGYVYGSLNHPSTSMSPSRRPSLDRPRNIKEIMKFLDDEKMKQVKLRQQKQKFKSFVAEPMIGRPVIDIPGIGEIEADRLYRHDITKASDLREVFLDLGKEEFIDWLVYLGIPEPNVRECTTAINSWCLRHIRLSQ
ncbi:uncharacterized protein [Diadema setosum]|uniref:uncharacterized protein n=1 Tax=Diadema setosum TaxID=31175 RepID=UPI003B3B52DA